MVPIIQRHFNIIQKNSITQKELRDADINQIAPSTDELVTSATDHNIHDHLRIQGSMVHPVDIKYTAIRAKNIHQYSVHMFRIANEETN